MIAKRSALCQALLLATGLTVGCQERREVQQPPPGGVQTERPAGEQVEDASVTAAVKSALVASPQVGALSIDVDTQNGVVTLTGTVESAAQKETAVRIARDTTGVREVVDRLVVQEAAPR